jgi:hypothetical protein
MGGPGAPGPSASQDPSAGESGAQDPSQDPSADPSQDPANVPSQDGSGGAESQPLDYIKQMLDLAKKYLDVEPDEQDKASMADLLLRLQKILAKDQSDADAALSGKVSPGLMRKVTSGAAQ